MAHAQWMLRHRASGAFVWNQRGAAPPEIVTDNRAYQETFSLSFPTVHVQWGSGDYDMMVSVEGAEIYKAGPVRSLTAPDFSTENRGTVAAGSKPSLQVRTEGETGTRVLTEIPVGARIASGDLQDEANQLLGNHGLMPGLRLDDPDRPQFSVVPPEQQVSLEQLAQSRAPLPLPELTKALAHPHDAPDYLTLLGQVRRCCIPVERTFADLLRGLPDAVVAHYAEHPEGINLNNLLLHGRKFVGMQVDGKRWQLDVDSFLHDDCSPKTRLYCRWWSNYQEIESQLEAQLIHRTSDADFVQCYQLALEMVHDAMELYMLETGWTFPPEPVPMGVVFPDVLAEMQARANFLADKDLEYGQPTRRHGIYGVVIRVFDKISRYTTLKAGKLVPKFESCADSLKDLGGYSMILAGAIAEELRRATQDGETTGPTGDALVRQMEDQK